MAESPKSSLWFVTTLRVGVQQLDPRPADLNGNLMLATDALRQAVKSGARLVVLPELATSGYPLAANELSSVAIGPDHPVFEVWARSLGDQAAVAVVGFCEAGEDGRIYNSAALIDGTGLRGVYRKAHLWDEEAIIFASGSEPPLVIDTAVGRIGVLICYDAAFPEMPRLAALAGADVIAVPANWTFPFAPPSGERQPTITAVMAAAAASGVAIACCDRAGISRGVEFAGSSVIVDADGWIVAEPGAEGTIGADIDLAKARNKKRARRNDVIGDRRPDLYGGLGGAEEA